MFALGTLTGMLLPRSSTAAAPATIVVRAPSTLAQAPVPVVTTSQPASNACGYVSGDIAGDANPATVYATMCGNR